MIDNASGQAGEIVCTATLNGNSADSAATAITATGNYNFIFILLKIKAKIQPYDKIRFWNRNRKLNLEALLVHPEEASDEQECETSVVFNKLKLNISIYNYIITRKLLDTLTTGIHLNPC